MARPFDGFINRKVDEIEREYERRLTEGFPVTLDGLDETLQLANNTDRTNWLTLLGICYEAIGVGQGDETIPVPIRCTSNRHHFMTFNECAEMLRDLRTWAAQTQANFWRLKDIARTVNNRDGLNLIDINQGWP